MTELTFREGFVAGWLAIGLVSSWIAIWVFRRGRAVSIHDWFGMLIWDERREFDWRTHIFHHGCNCPPGECTGAMFYIHHGNYCRCLTCSKLKCMKKAPQACQCPPPERDPCDGTYWTVQSMLEPYCMFVTDEKLCP